MKLEALRNSEVKRLLMSVFDLAEGSADTIANRCLKLLIDDDLISRHDNGHQNVSYSLTKKGHRQLNRLEGTKNAVSVQSDLMITDQKLNGNILEVWLTLGRSIIEHAQTSKFTLTRLKINTGKKQDRTFVFYSLPNESISEKFLDRTQEDFYYFAYAQQSVLQEWNQEHNWDRIKSILESDENIKQSVKQLVNEEESTNHSPKEEIIFADTLTT